MEDENGIELSLGLSCGASSGKSKARDHPDDKTEVGNNKLMGGNLNGSEASLKHFFQTSFEKQDSAELQKNEPVLQSQENFWTDLAKGTSLDGTAASNRRGNGSQFTRFQDLWVANNSLTEINEEKSRQLEIGGKRAESSSKRKMPYEDLNNQKKHEKEIDHPNTNVNSLMGMNLMNGTHVPATTDDGSSAENEDVAESEAEGSTSRLVSQQDDCKKYLVGVSDVPKNKMGVADSRLIDSQVQKMCNNAGKQSNFEGGNLALEVSFQLQPHTMSAPYSLPMNVTTSSTPMMQVVPPTSSEPVTQSMNHNGLQLAFGYSTVQLPTLDKGSMWGLPSHAQQTPSFVSKGPNDTMQNADNSGDGIKLSQANFQASIQMSEETGTCSSFQKGEEVKGSSISKPRETSDPMSAEGFLVSTIRPGVSPGVKFGGSGFCPDLPWVSTTGPGPNGRTISGVTYKVGPNQIKIVCACHGFHLSPEEFIQHAAADAPNPENSSGAASLPSNNPAASAQS